LGVNLYGYPAAIFFSLWLGPHRQGYLGTGFYSELLGRFAWNQVGLPAPLYYLLAVVTLAAITGCVIRLIRFARSVRGRPPWQGAVLGMLGVAFVISWLGAVLHVHPVFVTVGIYWPVARYATVAIIPTAMVICLGLDALVPYRWKGVAAWIGLLAILTLDAVALWSTILPYYYG
jgi:hypothetical protein